MVTIGAMQTDPLANLRTGRRSGAAKGGSLIDVVMLTTPQRAPLLRCTWDALLAQEAPPPFGVVIVCDVGDGEDEHSHIDDVFATLQGVPFTVRRYHGRWANVTEKLNAAFEATTAAWVMIWDDDDWSSPDRLACVGDAIGDPDRVAEFLSPQSMLRHELVAPSRLTLTYESPRIDRRKPSVRPIPGCMTMRRALWAAEPFMALPTTRPYHHELGHWLTFQLRDGAAVDYVDFTVVGMVHGLNMNRKGPYRIESQSGRVLDGPEYTVLGGREVTARVIGESTLTAYEAAAAAAITLP